MRTLLIGYSAIYSQIPLCIPRKLSIDWGGDPWLELSQHVSVNLKTTIHVLIAILFSGQCCLKLIGFSHPWMVCDKSGKWQYRLRGPPSCPTAAIFNIMSSGWPLVKGFFDLIFMVWYTQKCLVTHRDRDITITAYHWMEHVAKCHKPGILGAFGEGSLELYQLSIFPYHKIRSENINFHTHGAMQIKL